MAFRLVHTRYDHETERAYVELRDADDDGGEMLATAIFSFRTTERLINRQIEQEIARKARHILKRAAAATWRGVGMSMTALAVEVLAMLRLRQQNLIVSAMAMPKAKAIPASIRAWARTFLLLPTDTSRALWQPCMGDA
jgi:hypothetical protein